MDSRPTKKRQLLVVYDYGQGGVWAVIRARSGDEVTAKFPQLTVVTTRPEWMTEALYQQIAATMSFDIDDEARGWLRTLSRPD